MKFVVNFGLRYYGIILSNFFQNVFSAVHLRL